MDRAWMLRQDGKAFPITQHIYAMVDDDLSSEADAASFIIYSNSKDIQLAEYVIDCWLAKLIENKFRFDMTEDDIDNEIINQLNSLSYHFPYPLKNEQYIKIHKRLHNFYDMDSYYDFMDEISANLVSIQNSIKDSLNQQFCRVRFGGQYNSDNDNNSMWFRVSSVGYNWANTIYIWLTSVYRKYKVNSVFICRDYESDYGDESDMPEYFYKAKDGTPYFNMPIDEYLKEEHEHSPVFSNITIDWGMGILANTRNLLGRGDTFEMVANNMSTYDLDYDSNIKSKIFNTEVKNQCINCSEYFDDLTPRNKRKFGKIFKMIKDAYPNIVDIDVDDDGSDLTVTRLIFNVKYVDAFSKSHYLDVDIKLNSPLSDARPDVIFRRFRQEFSQYTKY